jgi:hypothetical protein
MNARATNFRLPLGGAEHHHQTYASDNVRKTLDTTWTDRVCAG